MSAPALTPTVLAPMIGADERLTPEQFAKLMPLIRQAMKDKSYQLFPMGQEAAGYLRAKRKTLTDASFREWEAALDKLARYFPDLELPDFELPVGAERVEEFMDAQWGQRAARTYNKNLTIVGDFFEWQVKRGRMHSDPTTLIDRAKTRQTYRTAFNDDQRRAIIASADDRRDRIALRLLLDYGLRQGALRAVQFKHFDHQRKRLTIFTKGGKVREMPIPHPAFWMDLERLILDVEAQPDHFLMPTASGNQHQLRIDPATPMSNRKAHHWWYKRLEDAGIVARGTTNGERMHKARHTAGQRMLDATGNLKAVQKLLGHASISTTADSYVDWDVEQLAASLTEMLKEEPDA